MVIGFLLCLFAPGFKAADSISKQIPIEAQIIHTEQIQSSTYAVSISDFQTLTELVLIETHPVQTFYKKIEKILLQRNLDTSNGLINIRFSRPPPSIFA